MDDVLAGGMVRGALGGAVGAAIVVGATTVGAAGVDGGFAGWVAGALDALFAAATLGFCGDVSQCRNEPLL